MASAQVIPLFSPMPVHRVTDAPAQQVPLPVVDVVTGRGSSDPARAMVSAALRSWMEGEPLTQREQRLVDIVLDTNYFGQLGRLAMGF